ncbi:MAG: hypothetical protein AB1571_04400 [Nanoarchaeota archaeon]
MRCKGKKKDGNECSRDASEGSEYCYQHINGIWNKITFFLANLLGVKRRFLLWFILFALVIFLIQGYANYQYNQILDNLKLKPDVEVEISPFLFQEAFGEYLPLIITNTGDYTFEDIHIFINSCEMQDAYYEHYNMPLLPSHSERTIPFGNKKVIESFKKGNCYPFAGKERSYASFAFNPWKINQGENYTSTSTGCGICFFDARVFAKYIDHGENKTFNKTINSYLNFPVNLTISISPSEE